MGDEYICDGCRHRKHSKYCRDCHRALGIDDPIHIVNRTLVYDDCYQGIPIKEPEML